MYCKYCGQQIDDNAAVCIHCGAPTDKYPYGPQAGQTQQQQTPPKEPVNALAIIGFILSFFVAVAGLVCSIIAYKQAPQYNGNGKNFALAGIIISACELAISVIVVLVCILMMIGIIGSVTLYY